MSGAATSGRPRGSTESACDWAYGTSRPTRFTPGCQWRRAQHARRSPPHRRRERSSPWKNRAGDSSCTIFPQGQIWGGSGRSTTTMSSRPCRPTAGSWRLGRGSSRTISLWDVAVGRENARFDDSHPGLQSFGFSPDSRYLVLRYAHGVIAIRDLVTGAVPMVTPAVTEPNPLTDFAFSPDGRFLATNVSEAWQAPAHDGLAARPVAPGRHLSRGARGLGLLFTQDGRSLIVDVNQAAIRWNYCNAREPAQPAGHADEAWSLAFSPDGSVLASGSDDTDEPKTIKLWDVATGRTGPGLGRRRGHGQCAGVRPGGPGAGLGSPGKARRCPALGRRDGPAPGELWPATTTAFAPSPSVRTGPSLATAGSDRTVRLWNVAERRCLHILTGHDDTVRQLSFSPDGTRLATAANDRAIRIWEVGSGRLGSSLPWVDKLVRRGVRARWPQPGRGGREGPDHRVGPGDGVSCPDHQYRGQRAQVPGIQPGWRNPGRGRKEPHHPPLGPGHRPGAPQPRRPQGPDQRRGLLPRRLGPRLVQPRRPSVSGGPGRSIA